MATRDILEILGRRHRCAMDSTLKEQPHLLLFYVGEDAYHFLVGTYCWPHDEWVDWCVTTLLDQVFGLTEPPDGTARSAGSVPSQAPPA